VPKVLQETVIPLSDASALFATTPTYDTVRRWADNGELEAARVGGRRVTSKEAVARALERWNRGSK
jgi:excisionase family DNA binding protein